MKLAKALSIFFVAILCASELLAVASITHDTSSLKQITKITQIISPLQSGVVQSDIKPLQSADANMTLNVMVSLAFRNQALLNSTLKELQEPLSKNYHKYLTQAEFISEFSPSYGEYNSYVNYFSSQGLSVTNTYADRVSIGLAANVSQLDSVFHTSIMEYQANSSKFYAPSVPLSLSVNYGTITAVSGLSNQTTLSISPLFEGGGSGQTLYGPDLQNAYQLDKLYQEKGYPTGETIASILWSGRDANGSSVGPFVPSDISTYFSDNLPANEPMPEFYAYPISSAPLPGQSAANDTSNAHSESTLDIEMAGSTAPGATIVEVYGPRPYIQYLDGAFAAILNPSYNATVNSALSHVVAISNSWTGTDNLDATWSLYEEEAAARGITVLASSGDNGNTYGLSPSFPASVAYDSYGTLAVGGTLTELNGSASRNGTGTTGILKQSVWYDTPNLGDGSQGGVSSVYAEPSWQLNSTDASTVITGSYAKTGLSSGRGTPDVAGVGANMLIYITTHQTGAGYTELWGTSIASPLVAGVIASIDWYIGSPEGFVNPFIYEIGQSQYQGTYTGASPFYFVYNGSNGAFSSSSGYNLAVGWGSINAYNFVIAQKSAHMVIFRETGLPIGTQWSVNIIENVTLSSTTSEISALMANGSYTYRINGSNGYEALETEGTVFINGNAVNVSVQFSIKKYTVQFDPIGLPLGDTWYLNFTFGTDGYSDIRISSASSSTLVYLPNGTYSYTVETGKSTYRSSPGTFTVRGSNISIQVPFYQVRYNVTFEEVGLASGQGWNLTVDGSIHHIVNDAFKIGVPNGSHSYEIGPVFGYTISKSSGNFTIDGSPLVIVVTYNPLAFIDLSIEPSNAHVYVNGVLENASNGHLNLSVLPGYYAIEISAQGYTTFYHNATMNGGEMLSLNVVLNAKSNPLLPIPLAYAVVATVTIIPASVIAIYYFRKRTR